jgi:MFS family permease
MLLLINSIWAAILFGVLWGVASGLERITLNIIWPNYFGRKYLGSIKGVAVTVMVIASSCGPLPLGIGFDMFQSYTQVLLLLLVCPLIGFICAFLAKKPEKNNYKELASQKAL